MLHQAKHFQEDCRIAEVETALENYKDDFEFLPSRLEDAFLDRSISMSIKG
jgi:hypothetical protein